LKTTKIEKIYPELNGLSFKEQHSILERAKQENVAEGNFVVWGPKLVLICLGITIIIHAILHYLFGPGSWVGTLTFVIVSGFCLLAVRKRNVKYLKTKVRELLQKAV